MPYFAIYEKATGRLRSLASRLTVALPLELEALDIGTSPADDTMWDEATRTFIPRPPKVFVDRLQDLVDRPRFKTFWQSLNAAQKDELRDGVIWLLGKARFRNESESPVVDE